MLSEEFNCILNRKNFYTVHFCNFWTFGSRFALSRKPGSEYWEKKWTKFTHIIPKSSDLLQEWANSLVEVAVELLHSLELLLPPPLLLLVPLVLSLHTIGYRSSDCCLLLSYRYSMDSRYVNPRTNMEIFPFSFSHETVPLIVAWWFLNSVPLHDLFARMPRRS